MKNRQFSKIAILALSLVLMIGAIFALTANAATTPEIANMNVQYTDKFSLVYAVPADTVQGGSATLYLYDEDPAVGAECIKEYPLKKTTPAGAIGLDYEAFVFYTDGVAALALDKVFYAQVVDANGNKSDVKSYSVVEYLYTRLADVDGVKNTDDQNGLYEYVIGFGTYAQKVFLKENVLANTTLISDYFYLTTTGCTVDGKTEGVFPQNKTFTVAYDNDAVVDYNLTTYEGYTNSVERSVSAIPGTSLNVSSGNRIHVAAGNINRVYKANVATFESETVGATPSFINKPEDGGFIYGDATYTRTKDIKIREDNVFGKTSKVLAYQPISTFGRMYVYSTFGCEVANAKSMEISFDMKVDTSTLTEAAKTLISERSDCPYYTFQMFIPDTIAGNNTNAVSDIIFYVLDDGKLMVTLDGDMESAVPTTVYAKDYNSFRFVLRYDEAADKNYIDVYVNNFSETPDATFLSTGAGVPISNFSRFVIHPGYAVTSSEELGATHYFDNLWSGYVAE